MLPTPTLHPRLSTLLTLFLFSLFASAQNLTISGYITDEANGEALIGASIYATKFEKGTITNAYGFYSITLPASDSLGLVFSYLGYQPAIKKIYPKGNLELSINLTANAQILDEVVVTSQSETGDQNISNAQMSVIDVPIEKIKVLPLILGEADVLKIIQLLPGVQSGNEGTAGFHVRGGNTDQNLVQLDEATVYNPNHLFGLFSTFNSRALNKVRLIKGGFPAKYGGRLSSVLDIQMKEGNLKKAGVEGGIGLITSQLTIEGPIKAETASFIISGRRTYLDLLVQPFLPPGNTSNYHFYDLNAKVNWKLSNKDRLFVSAFKGNDDAVYRVAQGLNYNILLGNATGTVRWNHLFGQKLFSNTSFIINQYKQDISTFQDNSFSKVFSDIRDIGAKFAFQYYPNPNHHIQFGLDYTNHRFQSFGDTGAQSGSSGTTEKNNKLPAKYYNDFALYFQDEIDLTAQLTMNIGLRLPAFSNQDISYFEVEPRVSLRYGLSPSASIKAAYTRMNQFLHLIPSATASVPTDIWVPSSVATKPQRSQQYALGYFRNFNQNKLEASVEVYYKTMDNQVLFKEGNQLIQNLDVDNFLTYGKGWSYGAEFFLKKNTGKLSGWISYTWSKTDQQFKELNFGEKFPFKYDRRHVLNLVASYNLSKHWIISGVFTYTTGAMYTLPVGRISTTYGGSLFEGNYFVYENRNNTRLKDYHRLDISLTYKKQRRLFKKKYDSELVFGFYNIYSRLNPYFVYLTVDPLTSEPKAKQVSLLPIIPSISYNFKF